MIFPLFPVKWAPALLVFAIPCLLQFKTNGVLSFGAMVYLRWRLMISMRRSGIFLRLKICVGIRILQELDIYVQGRKNSNSLRRQLFARQIQNPTREWRKSRLFHYGNWKPALAKRMADEAPRSMVLRWMIYSPLSGCGDFFLIFCMESCTISTTPPTTMPSSKFARSRGIKFTA